VEAATKGTACTDAVYACYHIVVDCVTATTDKALKTTGNKLCKDATKDAEEWGCTAVANCDDKGVYSLPTATQDLSFESTKYDKKYLKTAECNKTEKDKFATAAAADSSSGETKKDKAADDKAAGEDKKDLAYLFGVAAIAMLW